MAQMAEKALSPVIVAAADVLLDEGMHDYSKVKFFVDLLHPTTTPLRMFASIKLKCRNCAEEGSYTLKSPLVGVNTRQMCQRVKTTTLGLEDLYAAMKALGIICPSCYAEGFQFIHRWKDGDFQEPLALETTGDLVKGIMAVLEIYVDDPSLLNILRPYKKNPVPINKSLPQGVLQDDNDMTEAGSKFVMSESDEQMRLFNRLYRDAAKNKKMVADCRRIRVLVVHPSDGSSRIVDPANHAYESTPAADVSVEIMLCDIYDREKSSFWGLINHSFNDTLIPNDSVPPCEAYHFIPAKSTETAKAIAAGRKMLVEGPNAKDGYISAHPVRIPYHFPMARVEGGVTLECWDYVLDYVEATTRFRSVIARHGDEDRAVQEMLDGADNEATRDAAAAIRKSLGLGTPLSLQVSAATQDAGGLTSTLPRDKQHTISSILSRSPRSASNDRPSALCARQ